ncbi:hypothetical protein KKE26_00455 [bacterium]|nr:hypothetical protein [bacterium]
MAIVTSCFKGLSIQNGNRSGYNIKSVRKGIWRYDMRYGDNNIINALKSKGRLQGYHS